MHDPKVVAWDIPRPWPRITRKPRRDGEHWLHARHRRAKWYKPWADWSKFWRIGGCELYWPAVITIWHNEPRGRDSGEVCKRAWKYHVHHWSVQVQPLQRLRRALLTRCEWCGGRSRKSDPVNRSHQWDREPGHWWHGERGLFHGDCSSIHTAHATCVCRVPVLSHGDYGRCAVCDKSRAWQSPDKQDNIREITVPLLASIPVGERDPAKYAMATAMWRRDRGEPA